MTTMYTSELAASALHLAPEGLPHEGPDCVCAMCQRPLSAGHLSKKKELSRSFMDFGHLAKSDFVCGYCAVTANQVAMRELQRSVICREGIYNLNTDDARAWFWLTPPTPPFAVVINHNTMGAFHYYWRTPVTLDVRVVNMNVDGVVYQVRRSAVLEAMEIADKLLLAYNTMAGKKKELKSPFVMLARDPGSKPKSANGRLNPDLLAFANVHRQFLPDIEILDSLGTGELIALSPFLKQKPATPVQPELIKGI